MNVTPHAVTDKLGVLLAQLRAVEVGITDVLSDLTDETQRLLLLDTQRQVQTHLRSLTYALDIDSINALPHIPIMPDPALSPWQSAWQRAWPEYERMAFEEEHQVILKMGNTWLVVKNITNIREASEIDYVFMVGIATVATDGSSQLAMNKAILTKSQVFQFFLSKGYGVSDISPWRATLADAERSWSGAWAAADEWNATHDVNWRAAQIQAEAPCCDGTKTTTLCVNRTPAGLYEPGFYIGGNVMTVEYAIPEDEITGWYDSYEHKVDYRHDLAWEIVIPR